MNQSFFTSKKDTVLAAGSNNFSTKISASPTLYGLSAPQAAAYAALNTSFQSVYLTSITPSTRTKSTVAAKDAARIPLRQMASDLAKIVDGTPTVTNSQRVDLGIAVRATPAPRPAPGTPFKFAVGLSGDGSLTLTWKCNNPRGASGTIYQVWRRIGTLTTAPFIYLGGVGAKRFIDNTLPAGTALTTYQVQAVRSTAAGPFAQFNVSFGVSDGGPVVEQAAESTSTPRLAA